MKSKNLRQYKDEFIKLYKEGYSLRKIGEIYGVNKASIAKYVKEDCELRTKGLTDEEKEKARDMYLRGMNVNVISKSLGTDYSTTRRYLATKYGVVTNGEKKYKHLKDDIIKDYENGLNATQISEKYKISRQTVMNYVAESDVKARTYSETSRIYPLKEDYFAELNNNKTAILGMMFCKGRIDIRHDGYYVDLNVHNSRVDILDIIVKHIYYKDSPILNTIDNNLNLRIPSKDLYNSLDKYGLYNSVSKETKISKEITYIDSFWKGYIYAGMSINTRSITVSGYEEHIDALCEYLKGIGVGYRRSFKTNIVIENKKEIKNLIKNHGYLFIKTFIQDYVNGLDKYQRHTWNVILNEER